MMAPPCIVTSESSHTEFPSLAGPVILTLGPMKQPLPSFALSLTVAEGSILQLFGCNESTLGDSSYALDFKTFDVVDSPKNETVYYIEIQDNL